MRIGIFAAAGGAKVWPPGFSASAPGWPESISINFVLQSLDYTAVVIEYNDTATESISTNFVLQSLDYTAVVIEYNDTATESISTNFVLQSLDYNIP